MSSRPWWEQRWGLVEYSFDERVVREIFVVLRPHGFCFPQRSKPPLHLQIFISREALHNPTLFHEQLEFSGLIVVFGIACNFRNRGCEIDAPGSDPIPFYDTLIRCICLTPENWKGSRKKVVSQERCGD